MSFFKPHCTVTTLLLGTMSVIATLVGSHAPAGATPPPSSFEAPIPPHILQRLRELTTKRGFINLTRTIRANQAAARSGLELAPGLGGTQISGQRLIPVLTAKYKNTVADPFPVANLQRQLFDGPFPTGTMTEFYKEISYGNLNVSGTVFPWKKLSKNDSVYTGPKLADGTFCNGMCPASKLGDFLKEVLEQNVSKIDFTKYDNDGPDGIPNSGDDDGFVDFVAFVHPGIGGECGKNPNIWSHRFSLTSLTGKAFETKSVGKNGKKIKIDDYVIMPAKACDGTTMIQIGVFAHEFGHAFGLPDLYDTQKFNGESEGVGNWGLMGAGSWGGDNRTPAKPSHMSAWEKEFLGWVSPREIKTDTDVVLRPVEGQPDVVKVRISENEYYLLEYRQKTGFDSSLTGSGLAIWRINESVLLAGLGNNTVNGDQKNKGVAIVEADGRGDLDRRRNRGDAGDVFPFLPTRKFDSTTTPRSVGKIAICDIGDAGATIKFRVVVSKDTCN